MSSQAPDFRFSTIVRIIPERIGGGIMGYIPRRPPNTIGVVMEVHTPVDTDDVRTDSILVAWLQASSYVDFDWFEPQDLEIVTNV